MVSGRFAMIDNAMGFQLVPWRPAIEQQIGQPVVGVMTPGGDMDWRLGRDRAHSVWVLQSPSRRLGVHAESRMSGFWRPADDRNWRRPDGTGVSSSEAGRSSVGGWPCASQTF
ncbi:DUF3363 domain-containing protein [Brevundimonas olei]|uniref:DUF3363 domain-containing protein n=1 Tax=Brevundimonas olei TaxID=657642 RepID=UPI0031D28E10